MIYDGCCFWTDLIEADWSKSGGSTIEIKTKHRLPCLGMHAATAHSREEETRRVFQRASGGGNEEVIMGGMSFVTDGLGVCHRV